MACLTAVFCAGNEGTPHAPATTGTTEAAGMAPIPTAGAPPTTMGWLLKIPPALMTMCWPPAASVRLMPASITTLAALRCAWLVACITSEPSAVVLLLPRMDNSSLPPITVLRRPWVVCSSSPSIRLELLRSTCSKRSCSIRLWLSRVMCSRRSLPMLVSLLLRITCSRSRWARR